MSTLITHENTAISQENRAIEEALVEKLNTYLNIIRTVLDNSKAKWMDFRVILEPKFRPIVEQSIREAATLSYQLGSAYTAEKAGLPFFLTSTDIENIKQVTQDFTNRFFGRIQLAIDSTLDRRTPIMEPANSNINPNYIATATAIGITSKSLALGSTLKAKAIVTNGQVSSILQAAAAPAKKRRKRSAAEIAAQEIQDELDEAIEFEDTDAINDILAGLGGSALIGTGVSLLLNMQWVWTIQPGACTEYCVPLAGQTFDILDTNIPLPITDTHPNCRCRLLLA